MAGTILAEIVLEGGRKFTRTVSGAAEEVDELGDEAEETDKEVSGLSRSFSALSIGTEGISARVGTFGSGLKSLVPIFGTLAIAAGGLTLALAPLAIGIGAIAVAIGLIVGSGIAAWGKGFGKAMKKAQKQIMPMIKAFGEQFIPFLKETIGLLPGLVKAILKAIGPMDPFINALRQVRDIAIKILPKLIGWFFDIGRQVLPVVLRFSKILINNLLPALKVIVNIGQDIGRFIGRIITGFQEASKRGNVLGTRITRLKRAFGRFWTALQPVLKALGPLFTQLAKVAGLIGIVALDVLTLAINLGAKLLPVLVPIINFITGLVTWFNKLSPEIRATVVIIGGLIAASGPLIATLGTLFSALTTIVSVVGTVIAIFNPFTLALIALGVTIGGLAYLVYKHWNSIVRFTKNLAKNVTSWFDDMEKRIKQWGSDVLNWLSGDFVLDFIKWFVTLHVRVIDKVTQMLGSLMDLLTGGRGPLMNLASAGQALVDEFIRGIQSKISDVIATVEGMLQSVRDRLPFSPAKYGPLRDLDKTGPALVKTFAQGIRNSKDIALSAVESMVDPVLKRIQFAQDQLGQWAGESSRIATSGLFKNMPKDLIRNLVETFQTTSIKTVGSNRFRPVSSLVDLSDYIREAREYGFLGRRNGQPVFREDTASVAFEDLFRSGYNLKVEIKTDDDALRQWVDNRADVTIERSVRNALRQAARRGTFR